MSPRAKIFPVFLPMLGCAQACVYCDQRAISGVPSPPQPGEISRQLASLPPDSQMELAYYGGSFTCLPEAYQQELLDAARPFLAGGHLSGLRLSTRPDAADQAICFRLKAQGVTRVELGVQSFDDQVLAASRRGYDSRQALAACAAVKEAGLSLGVQLMTGLPKDSPAASRASTRTALAAGAELLRVYPTLVLRHTRLEEWYRQGSYQPQSLEEAIMLVADMLTLATAARVPVIRMGLHPGADLEAALVAGPYHPALGALVKEELRSRHVAALLQQEDPCRPLTLIFSPNELSLLKGQQGVRGQDLVQRWPQLTLRPDPALSRGELALAWEDGSRKTMTEEEYCQANAPLLESFKL